MKYWNYVKTYRNAWMKNKMNVSISLVFNILINLYQFLTSRYLSKVSHNIINRINFKVIERRYMYVNIILYKIHSR